MKLYLVAGTPGQSKAAAAEKIASFLREAGVKVGPIANVEDELLNVFPEEKEPSTSAKEPRVRLIGQRPQAEIKAKWPKAYQNAVEKAKSGNPDAAIVLLCFEYYRGETYEFYSPVNCDDLKESCPAGALTLIDDIFDIYYRLSQPGQVFDIQELIERTFPITRSGQRDPKDLRRLYKDALGVVIGSLLRLLTWREKEIECAANVTRMIGSEHAVLASKHPVETGARLLLGSNSSAVTGLGASYPVYVSHPISRPRRDRLNDGQWPSFVADLDAVVDDLAYAADSSVHIVPIMPTAIDEFRLLDDGTYLHPRLTPRWPLQKGPLLYSLPKPPAGRADFRDHVDYEERGLPLVFDPPVDQSGRRVGLPLSDPEVSGMMRNLRESIRLQMAGRDHLLVRQCPGFFLYRPLYGEYEFSGGVASEIHTYDQIRKYTGGGADAKKRHVAFIHDVEDATGLFSKRTEGAQTLYPYPVHQASGALHSEVSRLVDESEVQTRRPHPPEDATVSAALTDFGDSGEIGKELHEQMFPAPKPGSIGSEEPLDWNHTKKCVQDTVRHERVKALSSDIGRNVQYAFSDGVKRHKFLIGDDKCDTWLEVVQGLDKKEEQRKETAARTRKFFCEATE
ncbi:MAG: hypothetical protein ACOC8H_02535 [bacterium]